MTNNMPQAFPGSSKPPPTNPTPAMALPERTHVPQEEYEAMIGKAAYLWDILAQIHDAVAGDPQQLEHNAIATLAWRRMEVFVTQDGTTLQDPNTGIAVCQLPQERKWPTPPEEPVEQMNALQRGQPQAAAQLTASTPPDENDDTATAVFAVNFALDFAEHFVDTLPADEWNALMGGLAKMKILARRMSDEEQAGNSLS